MSEQPAQTPLFELAAGIPQNAVLHWQDGKFSHRSAPVGRYIHELIADAKASRAALERAQLKQTGGSA